MSASRTLPCTTLEEGAPGRRLFAFISFRTEDVIKEASSGDKRVALPVLPVPVMVEVEVRDFVEGKEEKEDIDGR
jgi:hypothetical protein